MVLMNFFINFAAYFAKPIILYSSQINKTMSNVKRVYSFGKKAAEGKADMKNLLGGKGANLAEMCLLGLPVPAGFTITTEACNEYYKNNCTLPEGLMPEVWAAMKKTEETMNMKFGDARMPYLSLAVQEPGAQCPE